MWARRMGTWLWRLRNKDSFFNHLLGLSSHLVWVLGSVILVFVPLTMVAGMSAAGWAGLSTLWVFDGTASIYEFLARPMLAKLPGDNSLIAIGTISPVWTPLKAALFVALCVAMPFILHEIWSFVAPGLYPWYDYEKGRLVYDEKGAEKGLDERGLALGLITTSALLFYLGIAFAYFVVFHILFGVVASLTPDAVNWTPDINELFGFMLLMFFSFGLVFEVPVAVFILVRAGVVELEALKRARRYVIVGAFVVAAIVTPPDVISQFLLAIPCWILYEFGLWFTSKWGVKKEKPKTAAD